MFSLNLKKIHEQNDASPSPRAESDAVSSHSLDSTEEDEDMTENGQQQPQAAPARGFSLNLNALRQPSELSTATTDGGNEGVKAPMPPLALGKLSLTQQQPPLSGDSSRSARSSDASSERGPSPSPRQSVPSMAPPKIPALGLQKFSLNIPTSSPASSSPGSEASSPQVANVLPLRPKLSLPISPSTAEQSSPSPAANLVKVDLIVPELCVLSLNKPLDSADKSSQQQLTEQVLASWFGPSTTTRADASLELYTLTPLNPASGVASGSQQASSNISRVAFRPSDQEFTAQLLRSVLHENAMLKMKLQKSAQALSFYEKENQTLRAENKELKQFKPSGSSSPRQIPVPSVSTPTVSSPGGSYASPDKEIEALKSKLQKHEQLRSEMIRTVDSLKRQHALLTQAIMSQQQLHENLAPNNTGLPPVSPNSTSSATSSTSQGSTSSRST